jgi:hypothetical protein
VSKDLNWQKILEKPVNIFNEKFVNSKLESMAPRKQAQVIRAMNKLSLKFKGMIPRRELPTVKAVHRNRNFVRIKDIILVIKRLILTKRKQLIHFGLDLYIILLAGMRFLADKDRIQKGVL